MTTNRDAPGVVVFPPALFAAAFFLGLIFQWFLPLRFPVAEWIRMAVAVLLFVTGATVALWGKRVMEAAGTNVNPALPSTAIVTSGPFRFTRNPLYLSMLGLYLGAALATNAAWLLILLVPLLAILHFGIVLREERYLEAKFGEPYLVYKLQVRRWI